MASDENNKTSISPVSPPYHEANLGFGSTTTSPMSTATRQGEGHLQYQPLPQQYLTNTSYANMIRQSRSPPTSPETLNESVALHEKQQQVMAGGGGNSQRMGVTSPTVTKLSKLYNQRHMTQGSSNAAATAPSSTVNANNSGGAFKENNFKPESGKSNDVSYISGFSLILC